jgi:hypothetical protein
MKIEPNDVKKFIVARCNERMKAAEFTNDKVDLYEIARLMKYELANIFAPRLICDYFLKHRQQLSDIIIKAKPYSYQWKAYQNKLVMMDEMVTYAESYMMTGNCRESIDVMVMRRGEL